MVKTVLMNIKLYLLIPDSHTGFDDRLVDDLNMIGTTLTQLGVWKEPYEFTKESTVDELKAYVGEVVSDVALILQYLKYSIRLTFDPPTSSVLLDIIKESKQKATQRILYDIELKEE